MNQKIKAILVDDEPDSIRLLTVTIEKHFTQVEIIASFTNSQKALEQIPLLKPELLFLDIEMPLMNGFDLLERLLPFKFGVVFVTAYNEFAIKAFKFNALDYLVKPVSPDDLKDVIAKVEKQKTLEAEQINILQQQFRKGRITKIAIPSHTGVGFIELKDIVFIEASNNYSNLILSDGRKLLISKTLKDIQGVMEEQHFLRIHRQYIINLNEVKHFNRNESLLTMVTNDVLPVSRFQKEKLVEQYGWL